MSTSYVYFLFKEEKIKIGKANDLDRRISKLEKDWGAFDQNKSFVLKCEQKNVNKLERALHALLLDYRINDLDPSLDGYTEFFDISCLEKVDSIIPLINYAQKVGLIEELLGVVDLKEDNILLLKYSLSCLEFDLLIALILLKDNEFIKVVDLEKLLNKKLDKRYLECISEKSYIVNKDNEKVSIFEELSIRDNVIYFKLDKNHINNSLINFCKNNVSSISTIKGFYSKRLFLFYKLGYFDFNLMELNDTLILSNSYRVYKIFNNRVLKPFKREMEKLGLNIKIEEIKTGRKVTAIKFIKN